ncbi:MAG: beta-ketoacyl-ACP synthase II [bacterium]|nr:MAG: beta-ketoacyl-ACP synthase II [bacterium]
MERRVVITTEAAITPIGNTKNTIIANLLDGVSGVKSLHHDDFLFDRLKSRIFGRIDYEIDYDFKRKYRKTMGPVAYYACQLAKQVIEASGLSPDFISSGRMGVAFGSTHGSPDIQRKVYRKLFADDDPGIKKIDSTSYLQFMTHTTAANITQMFSIMGRIISSNTACTTSSQSIGFGYEAIKYGLQDVMLCGGADEHDTTTLYVLDTLLATSIGYNNSPELSPRPFDKKRDGLVVAEGGGILLLEDYDFAKKRGATILAEIIGFSCGNNGGNLVNPSLEGIKNTLTMGIDNARIDPDQVDFISAHATATYIGDIIESQAIHSLYKNKPYVSGLKSYLGHTIAGCGVIETIITLYMMEMNVIFPTLHLDEIDEECKMLNLVTSLLEKPIRIATIENFAFGGVNTSLFIKKI